MDYLSKDTTDEIYRINTVNFTREMEEYRFNQAVNEAITIFISQIIDKIKKMKPSFVLREPYVEQTPDYTNYCSLCNTLEEKFEEIESGYLYGCKCSIWKYKEAPFRLHYYSTPLWMGWKDEALATELSKQCDTWENGLNEAYDNVIKLLEEMKNLKQ